jgi:hypothetical protein
MRLAQGDKEKAAEYFRKAVDTATRDPLYYGAAAAELRNLKKGR